MRPHTPVQVADYSRGASYGPRLLHDYEFVWVLCGAAIWTLHENLSEGRQQRQLLLTPGQLALAQAGTVDSYQWDATDVSSHAYVHFALAAAEALPSEDTWPATRSMLDVPILGAICDYLLELAQRQSARTQARSDELVRLLLDLFVTEPVAELAPGLPGYLAIVAEHVRDVWHAEGMRLIEVPELARVAGLSAGHLFRLFRHRFGCGPAHALELIRLARAAGLLQRSNATLTGIAAETGFANAYHLSRRFTAVYAMPPGAYRSPRQPTDPLSPVRTAGLLPMAQLVLRSRAHPSV